MLNLPRHKFKLFQKRCKTKWLLQKAGIHGNCAVQQSRRVFGHINNLNLRVQFRHLARKFGPAQFRHNHVRQQNPNVSVLTPRNLHDFERSVRIQHVMSCGAKIIGDQLPNPHLIVGQQNRQLGGVLPPARSEKTWRACLEKTCFIGAA